MEKLGISRYELVILINKRAIELMNGAKDLIETQGNSFIETAVLEILAGKIKLKDSQN